MQIWLNHAQLWLNKDDKIHFLTTGLAAMTKKPVLSIAVTTAFSVICAASIPSLSSTAIAAETSESEATTVPELPNMDKLIYGEVSYPDNPNTTSSSQEPDASKNSEQAAAVPEFNIGKHLGDPNAPLKLPSEKTGISGTAITVPKLSPSVPKGMSPVVQMKLLYKQGKFRDCLNVIEQNRPSELSKYYAGLCYQGQGQLSRATSEFQWVASYAKDPLIKYNAQMALQTVGTYAKARTYAGQGNNFARAAGGGGGYAVRRS